jgi:uncharacterized membrane protein
MKKKINIVIIVLGIILIVSGIFLFTLAQSIVSEYTTLDGLVQLFHDGKIDGATWSEIQNTINDVQHGILSHLSNIFWMAMIMLVIGIILIIMAIMNLYFEEKWYSNQP